MKACPKLGENTIIGNNVSIGDNVIIKNNCIIEDNVVIGDSVLVDNNVIIRNNVTIDASTSVGANCILGEYLMDYYRDHTYHYHPTYIGKKSLIRSGTIIYGDVNVGDCFQTGHHVTIREKTIIGNNVSVGTLSDIQGNCKIGDYTRLHSNVHVGMSTTIDECCWIFPYVVFTNDPTPPSETMLGVHVHPFSIVATGSVILPGVEIESDSLVGAGSVVNKNVERYQVVFGNPARCKGDIREIKNKATGKKYYPWRYNFDRNMPWENIGFDKWIESLDDEMKRILYSKIE